MAYQNSRLLRFTLWFIAAVQSLLGVAFLLVPGQTTPLLGLSTAPGWTHWLFGMMAARFLGFGYGMALAARDPLANLAWIKAMMVIQAIDWIVTLYYLSAGAVTLAQVTTASFLPVIFVMLLLVSYPKSARPGASTS
ncbi:MAG: hypothetical protein HY080_15085 [Gammaproteobacteria bacterium]|nr:hypothetical protein [Gammaproteobacteria bacterium]